MAHKGIRQYGGDEGSNVALGQLGFKVLSTATNTGDGNFVAFYVTGKGTTDSVDDQATIAATCHQGDDMTACIFTSGSLVYGAFKKITMSSPTDADVHVLCYYG